MTPGFTQLKTQINQFCLIDGERVEAIRLYITGTKFRNITGDPELTDVQVLIITELLDEMSPKGVFKEKALSEEHNGYIWSRKATQYGTNSAGKMLQFLLGNSIKAAK